MADITERQKLILSMVIHEHVQTAAPVGSNNLVKRFQLDLSSATVRNEMAALTESGYLRQPHTSAGREPTEDGYRYFVGNLLQQTELPDSTRHMISHQFYQSRKDVKQWMRLAASVLAHQSKAAAVVTAPYPEQIKLRHVELIATRGRQVLMVVVMYGGEVHQRFLTLSEPVTQEKLSETAHRLTMLAQGKEIGELSLTHSQLQGLDYDVMNWVIDEMEHFDSAISGDVYMDGLSNVLSKPEFSDSAEARRAISLLEEPSRLQDLLEHTLAAESVGGVQVLIGGEGTWDELRQWSIVLARYGMPGMATGALGVLGPIRMSYGQTISTVRYLSILLSDMVADMLVE